MTPSLADAQDHPISADVYLRHAAAMAAAKKKHEETGMEVARVKKAAKADAVDLDAHKMIEKLTRLDYDQQVIILRRFTEYGDALEMTSFRQLSLFDKPKETEATADVHPGVTVWAAGEAGLKAGRLGEPAEDCPFKLGTAHQAAWSEKHQRGLTERVSAEEMAIDGDEDPLMATSPQPKRRRGPARTSGKNTANSRRAEIPPVH